MTASYWFEGESPSDSIERLYPLRALAEETESPLSSVDESHALVARIRAGDETAFADVYREHATGLIGYAYRLSGSHATAQDAVAELFIHLWERRVEWRPRGSVRAYLYTAVRHRVMNVVRAERRADVRAGRVVADMALVDEPVSDASSDERLDVVWRVIDAFPPLRRQVMYLRWARGLTPDEVAAVLELNRNSVDQHLSRAIRAIREALPGLITDK